MIQGRSAPCIVLLGGAVLSATVSTAGSARAQASRDYGLDPELDISQYVYETWTTHDGLPHNAVQAIVQGRDGYLWLGTDGGLVRFDGIRFTVYNSRTHPAFETDRVRALTQTRDGTLWAGLLAGGLLSARGDSIVSVGLEGGGAALDIRSLAEDQAGTLWIGAEQGLARVEDGVLTLAHTDVISESVAEVEVDSDGALWVAVWAGLYRISDTDVTYHEFPEGVAITAAEIGRDGSVWVATSTHGLFRLRDGELRAIRPDETATQALSDVYEDRSGAVWVAAGSRGILRIHGGEAGRFEVEDGLTDARVLAFREDREGSLWFGTYGGGLNRFRSGAVTTYGTRQGVAHREVLSVFEDEDGVLWASGGGIARRRGRRFEPLVVDSIDAGRWVNTALQTRDGVLWVGFAEPGLGRLENGRMTVLGLDDAPGFDHVSALMEDRTGALWVGMRTGIAVLDGGEWTKYDWTTGVPGIVLTFAEAEDGTVWVGGRGGVTRFTGTLFESIYEGAWVRSLHVEADGTVWFGTLGGGLFRHRAGRTHRFRTADGLFDNDVWSIVEDDFGTLWMCSDRGIFSVTKRNLEDFTAGTVDRIRSESYGVDDGMVHVECNGGRHPSAAKTRDGAIWFPTQMGVVRVDPGSLPSNAVPPSVSIERVARNGLDLPLIDGQRLAPGQRDFRFRFSATSLLFPERVTFRYRLEGFEEDWVEGGDRTVRYTNLTPGTYRFRVRAANDDGIWSEAEASFLFHLEPYLYESRWIYPGIVALVVGLGLGLDWYRRRRQQVLEAMVRDRTAELEFANRGMSRFLVRMSHELRTPLNAIIGFSELLQDQAGSTMTTQHSRYVGNVLKSGRHLLEVINDILDLSKVEADRLELSVAPVRTNRLLAEIRPIAEELARKKGVRFGIEPDAEATEITIDALRIKQVLINLIGNAVKFTPAERRVTVQCARVRHGDNGSSAGEWIRLSVADEGSGIAADDLERIFHPFEQAHGHVQQGTGLGLPLSRKLVELHGGRLWAESEGLGRGSTFVCELPRQGPDKTRPAEMTDVQRRIPVTAFVQDGGRYPES